MLAILGKGASSNRSPNFKKTKSILYFISKLMDIHIQDLDHSNYVQLELEVASALETS